MTKTTKQTATGKGGRLLLTSSSLALLIASNAQAQQVIPVQQVINDGDDVTVTSAADGATITAAAGVTSTVDGAPVVVVANNDVMLNNAGTLVTTGVTQTVQVNQGTTGASINNAATGRIEADSRAVNFDGTDAILTNDGVILGNGDQRNGTVYANRTSNNITINNSSTGSIDAGSGNNGAGVAIEVGGGGAPRGGSITNAGTIQGRGQAAPTGGTAGDGIRFFGPGLAPEYIYEGDITNSGLINSESLQGTVAGVRFANRIGFQGTLTNEEDGVISGAQNGLYFGNDADHTGGVVNNAGTISSDSRALNIDGTGLVVNNSGSILGTGNQRNGTVYADSTAQDFELNNLEGGVIDAGNGNEGAGFSVELASAESGGNSFNITNAGTIQGRGNASAGAPTAGDGLRFERTRVGGALDATTNGLFVGNITNSGTIDSEVANGTAAGIRFVNGVSFQGVLENSGTISGIQNGLYFGNPTPAGGGDFSQAIVNNLAGGVISSGSRALNIDGNGLTVNNAGSILGTGNQRNGTVYADSTAQNFTLNNEATGVIDAGMGNEGAGFSVELSSAADGGNAFDIVNAGTIQGRGNASAGAPTAGDGLRFERTRNMAALDGTSDGLFVGNITNSGTIDSEAANGTAAGIRFVNGVSFQGVLENSGTVSGIQNGLYFGNPTPAGGGDFSQAIVNNSGTISSNSRALNIDGIGLTVNNSGQILGTGNQRNGTAYADGTADDFTFNNSGTVDAGAGNSGSGFGAEIGGAADGANTFTLTNTGTIQGRGNASAGDAAAGDGVRIGNVGNIGVFDGTITNSGTINSEGANGTVAGVRFVNGIGLQGTLTNEAGGVISGVQNGLYFGNPVNGQGADHAGGVVNNLGTISSGSRALNIDGIGLTVNNSGSILGTGNQRNGTVYADSTAQNFTLSNEATGVIDAGMGNEGAGFSVELASAANGGSSFDITNAGTIQGRGNAAAGAATAGDGLRFERARNMGALDGTSDGLFVGNITNSGTIASEAANGTAGGIRFVNGVSFQGTLENSGTITGVQNGLYFGNPTPAGGGDFSQAIVNNSGVISSGSRALNIDGLGLTVNNLAGGQILGLGNQRNGTVYADGTADSFTFTNAGTVDAGVGNEGSGFGAEIGGAVDGANTFTLTNTGTIQGRGQAVAGENGAGDGVRIGNVGNTGVTDAVITNSGLINSESTQGTTAGLRVINGVNFTGEIDNSGTISGGNHGIYLGNGDHAGATFTNSGTLSGGVNAFFAGNAQSAVSFTNNGGTLIGNFTGTTGFEDSLSITGTGNSIQGNILNNVAVTTAADSTTAISGARTLNGSLTHNGTLAFELGADSIAVDGDTTLASGGVVNIATTGISQANVGQTINVLTETGSFTNDGATINVAEDDFLIDYEVVLGSVAVAVSATDLGAVSGDSNVNAFGGAVSNAVAAGQLSDGVFNALNASTSAADFEATSLALLPAINEGVTREIFETQNLADNHLSDRLAEGEGTGLWGSILARSADRDADSLSVTGYDADAFGFTIGADIAASDALRLGVAYSYADIDVDQEGAGNEASEISSSYLSAYFGYNGDNTFVNGQIGYSFSDVDTQRTTAVGAVNASYDVDGIRAQLNAGLELGTDSFNVTPYVGLNYAELSADSYAETGGLNLNVDSASVDYFEGRIGARVGTNKQEGVNLRANAAYAYDFSGDARTFDLSFAGSGAPFRLATTSGADSRFEFGAGLDFGKREGISFSLDYQGEVASDYNSHAGVLRIRYGF